jgi:hypothetical protein
MGQTPVRCTQLFIKGREQTAAAVAAVAAAAVGAAAVGGKRCSITCNRRGAVHFMGVTGCRDSPPCPPPLSVHSGPDTAPCQQLKTADLATVGRHLCILSTVSKNHQLCCCPALLQPSSQQVTAGSVSVLLASAQYAHFLPWLISWHIKRATPSYDTCQITAAMRWY